MVALRSALPVRTSYRINVRSEPIEARTEVSEGLNRTTFTVSAEPAKVKFDIGEVLWTQSYEMYFELSNVLL